MRQDNVPDYGIPGAAWDETAGADDRTGAARRSTQTNYYGSVGYDYDDAPPGQLHRRASSTTSTRDLTLRNQTRYNRRAARSGDHRRFRTPAAFDAATQPGDARAPGQRAREHDHLEPDDASSTGSPPGACATPSTAGVEMRLGRAGARRRWPGSGTSARRSTSTRPNPLDPVAATRRSARGASTDGRTNTIGLFAFDTVDLGREWQVNGGLRARALRHRRSRAVDARRRRDRRPATALTRC